MNLPSNDSRRWFRRSIRKLSPPKIPECPWSNVVGALKINTLSLGLDTADKGWDVLKERIYTGTWVFLLMFGVPLRGNWTPLYHYCILRIHWKSNIYPNLSFSFPNYNKTVTNIHAQKDIYIVLLCMHVIFSFSFLTIVFLFPESCQSGLHLSNFYHNSSPGNVCTWVINSWIILAWISNAHIHTHTHTHSPTHIRLLCTIKYLYCV